MASINKLSVRGIRAFSPEEEEQVISFCFPLTIIVGANGCGKTTIIEALKYAVTGSLPPGNKSGQAFVHDPKSAGSSVVKAQVKLRFKNRAGKSMVVVRSMELTQKKTNMTFKNLDGLLRTTDDQGNKQSLSHKCTELDRQIPQLLGVSKSVLECVVFCHQEDSSWPLQEGAVLKKRFDDIFDSTRYVKALEEIKDQKKIYNGKVKDLKAEVNLLKGHKHAAGGFRNEFDECKQQLSEIADQMREFQNMKEEEGKKIEELQQEMSKGDELQASIDELNSRIDNEMVRIETHKNGLQQDFTDSKSKEELENVLKGFGKAGEADRRNLEDANERMAEFQSTIARLQKDQVEKSSEKGQLVSEKKAHDDNLQQRIELMEELATKYGLELTFSQSQTQGMNTQQSRFSNSSNTTMDDGLSAFTGTMSNIQITSEDLEAFQRSVELKRRDLEAQLKEHQEQSSRGEDIIQSELSELSGQVKSIENDLKRLESEKEAAAKELQRMSRTATSSRIRKSDIDEAKRMAARYLDMQNENNNDPRRSEIPKEIKKNNEKMSEIKESINEITVTLKELRACAEEQNKIDLLERQVVQDTELVEEMKDENSFLIQRYNMQITLDGSDREMVSTMERLGEEVGDKLDAATRDHENSSNELREIEGNVSTLSAVLNQNRNSLKRKTNELAILTGETRGVHRIKQIIRAVRQFDQTQFGKTDVQAESEPQQLLEYFTKRIGELATEFDKPATISRTMKKLRKMAKQTDDNGEAIAICPCCNRGLDTEDEIRTFVDTMKLLGDEENSPIVQTDQATLRLNSSATSNYENWRNTVSSCINDWLDHKRISTELTNLKDSIAKDAEELRAAEARLGETREKVETDREEQSNLQQLHDLIRRLRDDVGKIASKKSQISQKKEELSLFAPNTAGKNLRTVEREFNVKTEAKDTLMHSTTTLNQELADLNDNVTKLSKQVAKAEKIVRDKEEQFAQEQQAITRRKELSETSAKCKEKIDSLHDQIAPFKQKVRAKESERSKIKAETKREEVKRQGLLNSFNKDHEKISYLTKQIDKFLSNNKLDHLKKLESDLNSITEEVRTTQSQVKSLEPELEELKSRVSDKQKHQENIERNIEYFDMLNEQRKLEDEQDLLQDKYDSLDLDETRAQYSAARKKIEKYKSECDQGMGRKDTLMKQARDLKRKLQASEYKDIDERHRVKMIEQETCSMAVSDLDLYYNALDKALLRYHGIKIEEINKIIKELWTLTYRGEDITNIRLTSDQERNSRATRSYNYRVVMTKGTTELDMRGRCSAGQRVLASIVIRLALAETFCINCGVMALDEPTTNLDHQNKYGLAVALAQIIASRAAQENFQLVIITHDEEFVSMMKQELSSQTGFDMPDRYFQVSREESSDGCYYSKINAIDWDEI